MKIKTILLSCIILAATLVQAETLPSKGSIYFEVDGKKWISFPDKSKCWTSAAVKTTLLQAQGANMQVSWQIQNMNKVGELLLVHTSNAEIKFILNNQVYLLKGKDAFMRIRITEIKQVYNVQLLSGTFEARLHTEDGKSVHIRNGRFITNNV